MNSKICRATKKDLKKILEIFIAEYGKPPYNENWKKENALKKVKEYFNYCIVNVAFVNGKIAGFVVMDVYPSHQEDYGSVYELIVSQEFQGLGIGKELMQFAENYFKKRKIKKLQLMVEKKSKAFRIYKKWGFKLEDFYSMVKELK